MKNFSFTDKVINDAYGDFRCDYPDIVEATRALTYDLALCYLTWYAVDHAFDNSFLNFYDASKVAEVFFTEEERDLAVDKFKNFLIHDFPTEFNGKFYSKEES